MVFSTENKAAISYILNNTKNILEKANALNQSANISDRIQALPLFEEVLKFSQVQDEINNARFSIRNTCLKNLHEIVSFSKIKREKTNEFYIGISKFYRAKTLYLTNKTEAIKILQEVIDCKTTDELVKNLKIQCVLLKSKINENSLT